MRSHNRIWVVAFLALGGLIVSGFAAGPARVLIFHKQNGYIHTATDEVVARIKSDLIAHGLNVENTVDSLAFTPQNLARFGAVVFINTNYRNGALLTRTQEAAFEGYLHAGGGFAGIHSAVPLNGTAEEAIWPWYARLFGARFRSHAAYRKAPMVLENWTHFSTKGLPERISLDDEWYAVQANPRADTSIHVLATVDETGFLPESSMGDHPVTWYRTFEGARAWMTLVGHDMAAFNNANFLSHIRGGIQWAGSWDTVSTVVRPSGHGLRTTTWTSTRHHGIRLELRMDGRHIEAKRIRARKR